jgi:hypothetical protein
LKGGEKMKHKEVLTTIGYTALWFLIGAGLIIKNDNGGFIYILFGIFMLLMELVSEKWACERLKRELSRERKQHGKIVVKVGE